MQNAEIAAVLTKAFNAAAARPVLERYNATLEKVSDARDIYLVNGVKEADATVFLQEFRKLKGVRAAYVEPPPQGYIA